MRLDGRAPEHVQASQKDLDDHRRRDDPTPNDRDADRSAASFGKEASRRISAAGSAPPFRHKDTGRAFRKRYHERYDVTPLRG